MPEGELPAAPVAAPGSAAEEAAMSETELPPAPSAPAPGDDAPEPKRAADFSAEQLAAVERMIEQEVEAEEKEAVAPEGIPVREPWLVTAGRRAAAAWLAVVETARGGYGAVDRVLEPYALSCKKLLGIAGIITLCVVGALSFKIWVLRIY
jgi:hypothetical protein